MLDRCSMWFLDLSVSLSDTPDYLGVYLKVCLMHQVLFGSICLSGCTRLCVDWSVSLSNVQVAVWVCLSVCLMHQVLCRSVCQFV